LLQPVIGAVVVACSDASGILETAEHALDLVAMPIGSLVMRIRFAAIDCLFLGSKPSSSDEERLEPFFGHRLTP
jgi:hypothetical protein